MKIEFIWVKKDNCYIQLFYSHTVIMLLQLLIIYSNENFSIKLICDDQLIETVTSALTGKNNSRIFRIKNAKFSGYYFHMN